MGNLAHILRSLDSKAKLLDAEMSGVLNGKQFYAQKGRGFLVDCGTITDLLKLVTFLEGRNAVIDKFVIELADAKICIDPANFWLIRVYKGSDYAELSFDSKEAKDPAAKLLHAWGVLKHLVTRSSYDTEAK